MTFVDTNVLIDIVSDDPDWFEWSSKRLIDAHVVSDLLIDAVVVGEMARGFATLRGLLDQLDALSLRIAPIGEDVAFLAGTRFAAYRATQASRTSMLVDFLIGAHALSLDIPLLTRDPRLYRRYFPELTLITPENDHG